MRTPLRRCCALGLAVALACGLQAEVIHEGEHVTLVIDPTLEACGDMVGHMDHFVATLADTLGASLPEKNFAFVWYSELGFLYETRCPRWTTNCTGAAMIFSRVAPFDYDLARVVLARVGSPPAFYAVGAAVVFAPDSPRGGDFSPLAAWGDVQANIALGGPPEAQEEQLAGAFTRLLIDRHGLEAYLEFYARVAHDDSLPEIEAVHLAQFGESLTETILAFDGERRHCARDRFGFKLVECGAPPIAWDGDSLLLRRSLACGDDDVIGPFGGNIARAHATLEVEAAGFFEVSLASDEPQARARFGSCGGCDAEPELRLAPRDEPVRRWLPAGRYYLALSGEVEAVTTLALRLERIDEP